MSMSFASQHANRPVDLRFERWLGNVRRGTTFSEHFFFQHPSDPEVFNASLALADVDPRPMTFGGEGYAKERTDTQKGGSGRSILYMATYEIIWVRKTI